MDRYCTPRSQVVHQARQVSTGSFPLPGGHLKGIQPQEGPQIRAGEGSLRHVEVSQVACVAAPIIRGPRPLPGVTTHPPHLYTSIGSSYHTLKHEEPDFCVPVVSRLDVANVYKVGQLGFSYPRSNF